MKIITSSHPVQTVTTHIAPYPETLTFTRHPLQNFDTVQPFSADIILPIIEEKHDMKDTTIKLEDEKGNPVFEIPNDSYTTIKLEDGDGNPVFNIPEEELLNSFNELRGLTDEQRQALFEKFDLMKEDIPLSDIETFQKAKNITFVTLSTFLSSFAVWQGLGSVASIKYFSDIILSTDATGFDRFKKQFMWATVIQAVVSLTAVTTDKIDLFKQSYIENKSLKTTLNSAELSKKLLEAIQKSDMPDDLKKTLEKRILANGSSLNSENYYVGGILNRINNGSHVSSKDVSGKEYLTNTVSSFICHRGIANFMEDTSAGLAGKLLTSSTPAIAGITAIIQAGYSGINAFYSQSLKTPYNIGIERSGAFKREWKNTLKNTLKNKVTQLPLNVTGRGLFRGTFEVFTRAVFPDIYKKSSEAGTKTNILKSLQEGVRAEMQQIGVAIANKNTEGVGKAWKRYFKPCVKKFSSTVHISHRKVNKEEVDKFIQLNIDSIESYIKLLILDLKNLNVEPQNSEDLKTLKENALMSLFSVKNQYQVLLEKVKSNEKKVTCFAEELSDIRADTKVLFDYCAAYLRNKNTILRLSSMEGYEALHLENKNFLKCLNESKAAEDLLNENNSINNSNHQNDDEEAHYNHPNLDNSDASQNAITPEISIISEIYKEEDGTPHSFKSKSKVVLNENNAKLATNSMFGRDTCKNDKHQLNMDDIYMEDSPPHSIIFVNKKPFIAIIELKKLKKLKETIQVTAV